MLAVSAPEPLLAISAVAPLDRADAAAQPRGDWTPVVWYALVSAAIQMLWLSFAAITTDSAHHYGVSVTAIGWLSEISPLRMWSWRFRPARCSTTASVPPSAAPPR